MKRILITGKDSYIGNSFTQWLSKWYGSYEVDTIDMRNDAWRNTSFESYDVVYHLAAVVHVKEKNPSIYFSINRDLAFEVANKAKAEGVKQFVFLSTMGVYGKEIGHIDKETLPNPITLYGKSKLAAEEAITELESGDFKVAILRPPLVYGKGCRGNYPRLIKLAQISPFFPQIMNQRSMIFIDYLSEFVRLAIENELSGLFFPQNSEFVCTYELIEKVSSIAGFRIKFTTVLNPFVKIGSFISKDLSKVFGSYTYDLSLPGGPGVEFNYETCTFEQSLVKTEER